MKKFGVLVAMLLTAALLFTGCAQQEGFDPSNAIAAIRATATAARKPLLSLPVKTARVPAALL